MTCIVGIEHNGRVYIGGDSAGVAGYDISVRADSKVFRNGPFVMGFTTSFRMGQVLRYRLQPPEPLEGLTPDELDQFMVNDFVDAVRETLSEAGWLTKSKEQEEGGTFLVGIAGVLYGIQSDFQISRTMSGYDAVGCGQDLALGALHATQGRPPRRRIKAALKAAAHHNAGVVGPFTVVTGQ